jgi:selenide, water dikinase
MEELTLTSLVKQGGCSCKIAPAVLQDILQQTHNTVIQPELIIGNVTHDDAALYQLPNNEVLVCSTDFFTPMHNDAYTYGCIAAANALSDIYAMGARPFTAMAQLVWPTEKLPPAMAASVLQGAIDTCKQVGIAIGGGHSIVGPEPVFGLSVNGLAPSNNIKLNSEAQVGDVLILTKPLGTGILSSAYKRQVLEPQHEAIFVHTLKQLNTIGEWLGTQSSVHALTDVTGFGLLGHLSEMCLASKVGATINYSQLPILPEAIYYLSKQIVPDATYRNWQAYSQNVQLSTTINTMQAFQILPDPQTNGGLLIAANPNSVEQIIHFAQSNNHQACIIGSISTVGEKLIQVV